MGKIVIYDHRDDFIENGGDQPDDEDCWLDPDFNQDPTDVSDPPLKSDKPDPQEEDLPF